MSEQKLNPDDYHDGADDDEAVDADAPEAGAYAEEAGADDASVDAAAHPGHSAAGAAAGPAGQAAPGPRALSGPVNAADPLPRESLRRGRRKRIPIIIAQRVGSLMEDLRVDAPERAVDRAVEVSEREAAAAAATLAAARQRKARSGAPWSWAKLAAAFLALFLLIGLMAAMAYVVWIVLGRPWG